MRSDKDRPSTWKPYKLGMCDDCTAACCTMPVELKIEDLFLMELIDQDEMQGSPKKVLKKLQKTGLLKSYRDSSKLFMLQQRPNGDCPFLGTVDRLCTIYDRRPSVCREFPKIGPRPGYCPKTQKNI